MTRSEHAHSRILAASAIILVLPLLAFGQQSDLFVRTDALMNEAIRADAAILAPKNFTDATARLAKAKDQAARGRVDRASEELKKADELFAKALEVSKLGAVSFASTLQKRDLAEQANAPQLEADKWKRAEDQFRTAALALESGNVNSANSRSAKAAVYYDEAELEAIKTGIVGKARQLIAAADAERVSKEAPQTLDRAKSLVAKAESSLDADRYQTAAPMADAAEAEYEARHATYIAMQIRRLQRRDVTGEEFLLEWEKPLKDIAAALDVSTDFSDGYEVPAAQSIAKAEELRAEAARVAELEAKLGGTEALARESQRLKQQLAEVESLFGLDQARVIREGNDLVIRLVGLSFPSGQSVIETKYYSLLRNVQRAIAIFPDALIGIEGHTDSVGDDMMNMRLSQERANSVREYLIANLGLRESQIEAFGFGKSRPIASNETAEGRAQNRRIDVVIRSVMAR